jgi:hypothetical protein
MQLTLEEDTKGVEADQILLEVPRATKIIKNEIKKRWKAKSN